MTSRPNSKPATQSIRVELAERSYFIHVSPGALASLGKTVADLGRVTSVAIICDSCVARLYGKTALDSVQAASLPAAMIEFPAGEASKNLTTYGLLFDKLFALRPAIDRGGVLVALGGGVTGDLTGFVAATALRGLRYVQCATTLLAAVDSSIGGKTAVDHGAGKNLIGAFHQPSAVLIDVRTLKTLPLEEVRSGLAECVKHAVIRDAAMVDYIDAHAEDLLACREDVLTEFIARNVAIKAGVVASDEKETGPRAHLNFGHTIGHAIETFIGYDKIRHGDAVSLGMVAACEVAVRRGLLKAADAARVEQTLRRLGLPVRRQGLDAGKLLAIMQHDKKAVGGTIRLVLPTAVGAVDVFRDTAETDIRNAIERLSRE